ncbi:MAG: XisI protein [Anaerolineales bacterium]|nr:XisI protein [Anaerolineales bacterium]
MAEIATYQRYIQEILHSFIATEDDERLTLVCDTTRNHYQLLSIGWEDELKRILNIIAHVDIIDGKIWIQRDFTEPSISEHLLELGVPPSDIVLGFQPPYKRVYSDFAVC